MNPAIGLISLLLYLQPVLQPKSKPASGLAGPERAAVFAVRHEVQANGFEKRKDLCLEIETEFSPHEREMIAALKRDGLRIHSRDWCKSPPRGVTIAVLSSVEEKEPGKYTLTVQTVDRGTIASDLGAILRQGTYTVNVASELEPVLVAYAQTCCSVAGSQNGSGSDVLSKLQLPPAKAFEGSELKQNPQQAGAIQMLTPTDGVDFSAYLHGMVDSVRRSWYAEIPKAAREGEKGTVVVQFSIRKDGALFDEEPRLVRTSGHKLLDEAAVDAIRRSSPFDKLPVAFDHDSITLRIVFLYNLPMETIQK